MKRLQQIVLLILFLPPFIIFAQKKENPIVFYELNFGRAIGSTTGWFGGGSLNYQFKNDLFTARYTNLTGYKYTGSFLGILPTYAIVDDIHEYGILYGKRYTYDDHSFSYSVGFSYLNREFDPANASLSFQKFEDENYFGFPFEVNLKFFKPERQRVRLYYLIPVGKPTSFGGSFGLKVIGNISKRSFLGLGFSYSFGWHKKY